MRLRTVCWTTLVLGLLLHGGCDSNCPVGLTPVADAGGNGHGDGVTDAGGTDAGGTDGIPPQAGWVIAIGGDGVDSIWTVVVDDAGDLIVSGVYSGTVSFGTTTLTSAGDTSSFVAKLDPTGAFRWAVTIDGIPPNKTNEWDGLAVDASGNIYYAGQFEGTARFGAISLNSNGAEDIFVVKLDPGGNVVWAVSAGGPGSDVADAIAAGPHGELTLGGRFAGTASFGATTLAAKGLSDLLVARLDAKDGRFVWAVKGGGDAVDIGDTVIALAVDLSGNTYITGGASPNAILGEYPLPGIAKNKSAFYAKLDPSGTFLYADSVGLAMYGADIVLDGVGSQYIAANIRYPDVQSVGSVGSGFVAKRSVNGTAVAGGWIEPIGASKAAHCNKLLVDSKGNTTLAGYFRGTMVLGLDTFLFGTDLEHRAFIAQLDPSGEVTGGVQIASYWSVATGLARDARGNTYISGGFTGTASFDGTTLTSKAESDGFLWNRGSAPE